MTCPFLKYRRESGELQFDEARAYCGAAERFVQPMRADICNDRYDLDHAAHCEIYRAHAEEVGDGGDAAGARDTEDTTGNEVSDR